MALVPGQYKLCQSCVFQVNQECRHYYPVECVDKGFKYHTTQFHMREMLDYAKNQGWISEKMDITLDY